MNRAGVIEEIKMRNLENRLEQYYQTFNSRVHGPYPLTMGGKDMFWGDEMIFFLSATSFLTVKISVIKQQSSKRS